MNVEKTFTVFINTFPFCQTPSDRIVFIIDQLRLEHEAVLNYPDPYSELMVLPFDKLQHLCRHEKGRYCKELRDSCEPPNCTQNMK